MQHDLADDVAAEEIPCPVPSSVPPQVVQKSIVKVDCNGIQESPAGDVRTFGRVLERLPRDRGRPAAGCVDSTGPRDENCLLLHFCAAAG